jgi:hypothetical protein
MQSDLFQLVQIAYWLSLATWFGGVLFVAIAAQVIHRTVREANPMLPHVLAVNLDNQHATLLSGTIVANLMQRMTMVELVCGGVLVTASIAQIFLVDLEADSNRTAAILRGAMLIAAVGLTIFHWRAVWPRIEIFRKQYIEHADDPEIANPARDQFDREQKTSLTVLMTVLFLLLGMILFSGNITPRGARSTVVPPIVNLES